MRRPRRDWPALGVIGLLASAPTLAAQALGLPEYHPINPVVETRSGLYFQPYRDPQRRWTGTVGLDYGSMVELGFLTSLADTSYLLDAEVLRLNLAASRDLDRANFVTVEGFLGGAYGGFLDGFLNWYHRLFGIDFPEREDRRPDRFDYRIQLPGGQPFRRAAASAYFGDLRLGIGHRYDERLQSHFSVTLPTATAPTGYGRGTVSFNLTHTLRAPLTPRLIFEGSVGTGFTPRHGDLAPNQQRLFLALTSGARYRFWGRLSAFANFFYQSAQYEGTGIAALDRKDLTLDFGWILRTKSGREWRIGMTEDPSPSGPAIDLVFRFGTSW